MVRVRLTWPRGGGSRPARSGLVCAALWLPGAPTRRKMDAIARRSNQEAAAAGRSAPSPSPALLSPPAQAGLNLLAWAQPGGTGGAEQFARVRALSLRARTAEPVQPPGAASDRGALSFPARPPGAGLGAFVLKFRGCPVVMGLHDHWRNCCSSDGRARQESNSNRQVPRRVIVPYPFIH